MGDAELVGDHRIRCRGRMDEDSVSVVIKRVDTLPRWWSRERRASVLSPNLRRDDQNPPTLIYAMATPSGIQLHDLNTSSLLQRQDRKVIVQVFLVWRSRYSMTKLKSFKSVKVSTPVCICISSISCILLWRNGLQRCTYQWKSLTIEVTVYS